MRQLDVRPILLAGGEPLDEILAFVGTLAPGEGFELLATFRPDPLIGLLGGRGYDATAETWDDGTWCVRFTPRA